jgi:hypothetical protein
MWVIVATETELHAALPALLLSTERDGEEPDDLVEPSPGSCLLHALAAVKRAEPVALLLSEAKELLQVRFPSIGHVRRHWRDGDNRLRFGVNGSPVVFTLPPDERALSTLVTDARDANTRLLVLEASFDGLPTLIRPWDRPEIDRFCDAFQLNPATLTALSEAAANELYKKVFALNSERPYTEGIPFRWSHSYCEAKAQAIRAVLRTIGINVGKAWAVAKPCEVLQIATTSRRGCVEQWAYHVAVIVRAKEGGSGGFWVFDPTVSLKAGVLSFDAWKSCFGAGLDHVHLTKGAAYEPCDLSEMKFEAELDGDMPEALKIARCLLSCLAHTEGHPPFCCSDEKTSS